MRYNYAMESQHPILLHIVLLQEGEFWVAQALEYDIAAQGKDIKGAQRAFLRTLSAQVQLDIDNGRTPLEGIGPAPEWYFQAFTNGRPLESFVRPPIAPAPYNIIPAVSEQHAPIQ
jgi:hypothetical protein